MKSHMTRQSDSYSPEVLEQEEDFYRRFWWSPKWGTANPNVDEKNRARGVLSLLGRHVLPMHQQKPRLLDLGCGRGWLTQLLSLRANVLGLDPVHASVERARELFPHLEFKQGYSDDLLDDPDFQPFDIVVASEVIEHVPDGAKPGFVESIYRLLKPGGFCLLTTPRGDLHQWWLASPIFGSQPVEHWVTEQQLDDLMRRNGFEVVKQQRVWVPKYRYSFPARLVSSRYFAKLVALSPQVFEPVRDRFGFYQLMLARKT